MSIIPIPRDEEVEIDIINVKDEVSMSVSRSTKDGKEGFEFTISGIDAETLALKLLRHAKKAQGKK